MRRAQTARPARGCLLGALLCLAVSACSESSTSAGGGGDAGGWISAWGTANYTTYPNGPLSGALPIPTSTGLFIDDQAHDQSFRMMITPTVGGDRVRLQFSNAFGDRPLTLRNVSVARRALPLLAAVNADSLTPVRFGGADQVTIAPGDEIRSDAVTFSYDDGEQLAVSFHVEGRSGPMSWHAEAFALQFASLPGSGDVAGTTSGLQFLSIDRGWFFLSSMDVRIDDVTDDPESAPFAPFTIVAFGDSITDGFLGTPELDHRWPDFFARRLQEAGIRAGVVNAGINSNTVLDNNDPVTRGVAGIERFGRDVLQRSGVRSVFVLLGTNDITSGRDAGEILAGLEDLAAQAHAAGICVVVSTILPRNDPPVPFGWNAAEHAPVREELNARILQSTAFDAVVDLAAAMQNPLLPGQPNPLLFVEGLHPNSLGMSVLANAIPLHTLVPEPRGTCAR